MTQYVLEAKEWLDISKIFKFFHDFKRRRELHKNIRSTINELSKLTDRELNDIGISRGDIYSVAHEAYYDDLVKVNKNLNGWV